MTATPPPSAALLADLSLVLPDPRPAADLQVRALARGKPLPLDQAVATAAQWLAAGPPPAIVGLTTLSIESLRHVVALARATRARLLPNPQIDHPISASAPVTQTATLGHLAAADLFVCVGCNIKDLPTFFRATPDRILELPGALDEVIQLRIAAIAASEAPSPGVLTERASETPSPRVLTGRGQGEGSALDAREPNPLTPPSPLNTGERGNSAASIDDLNLSPVVAARILAASSVAVLLTPDADPRLASQWHKLAAELQQRVRIAVARLPDPNHRNARGVAAVAAWSTGLSCAARGLDFAADPPSPCTSTQGCALILDTTAAGFDTDARAIAIADVPRPAADLCFITPGLALGIAARVMRSDGQILWLCDDPAAAPPDPTAMLLARILAAIK